MRVGVEYRMLAVGREQINRGLGRYTQQQLRAVLNVDHDNEYVLLCDERSDISLIDPAVRHAPNVTIRRFGPERFAPLPPDPDTLLRRAEEYQAWIYGQSIDVYHSTTPFVLVSPLLAGFDACPMVANFYDVIPLVFPDHYLSGWYLEQYERTLTFLMKAERLLAISHAAKQDATVYLGVPPERVDVAWPIPDACFRRLPPDAVTAGLERIRRRMPLPDRYVMTVSHFHHSKNLYTLLRAYSLLPAAFRSALPLVIACHLDAAEEKRLAHMAAAVGVSGDVVTTGLVSDEDLALLYNAAELVVHPSRYEGFGLPVVEAMSCGTAVITTTASSMPEVAGDAAVLVDPDDADALAGHIEHLATDTAHRDALVQRGLAHVMRFNARQLAQSTLASYQKALAPTVVQADVPRRPRIALWTPFPPQASGVADYAVDLLEGLRARYDVEVFVDDGCLPPPALLRHHHVCHATAFGRRNEQAPFDVTIYQLGRSLLHLGALQAAQRHPGVVVFHDLAVGQVLYADARQRADFASFRPLLAEAEGEHAAQLYDLAVTVEPDLRDQLVGELLTSYPMLNGIVEANLASAVHTEPAADELRRRCPDACVVTVPMGVGDPYAHQPAVQKAAARRAEAIADETFVVGLFGVVHPSKRPEVALAACAELVRAHADTLVLVVGPEFDPAYGAELRAFAADRLGIAANVRFTGHVPRHRFDALLVACDAVVNLRSPWTSHLSAVALRAAAAGKPVLLSDLADWASLPAEPFLRVPFGDDEVPVLANWLVRLASDRAERARLSRVARGYWARAASIERMAEGYTAVIERVLADNRVPA